MAGQAGCGMLSSKPMPQMQDESGLDVVKNTCVEIR